MAYNKWGTKCADSIVISVNLKELQGHPWTGLAERSFVAVEIC